MIILGNDKHFAYFRARACVRDELIEKNRSSILMFSTGSWRLGPEVINHWTFLSS